MKIHALNDSIDYIKSWLQFRYEREEIPGFIVAVSHKGKLIMNEAYGYANIEQKKSLNQLTFSVLLLSQKHLQPLH